LTTGQDSGAQGGPQEDGEGSLVNLKRSAVEGAVLMFLQYGGSQLIRLAGNLALTRLLTPEVFGLMAMVQTMVYGLAMISDVGLQDSIIRSKRGDDPAFLDTIWTLKVIRGFAMFAACCVAAVPYARFYEEPILSYIVPAVGVGMAIRGFESTKLLRAGRHLKLRRVVAVEISTQILGLGATVLLCFFFPSVWSLIVGRVLTASTLTFLSVVAFPGRNDRFRLEGVARREITTFGRWILVSSVLTFLATSADRLVIGKVQGMRILGVYSVASVLAQVPAQALGQIAARVVYPMYSSVRREGGHLGTIFDSARRPLLFLTGWILAAMVACGPSMVSLFYDHRYAAAGLMVQLLSVSVWFEVLDGTNVSALKALGQPRAIATATALRVAVLAALPFGAIHGGIEGAIGVLVAASVARYAVTTFAISTHGVGAWYRTLPATAWILVSAGAGYFGATSLTRSPLGSGLIAGVIVSALWAPALYGIARKVSSIARRA